MDSIYDTLMGLPLFQGISRMKLSELVEKIPFYFLKHRDGENIISVGDKCDTVLFLVSGEARIDIPCQNKRIHFLQTIAAPNVIGADYLFGKVTRYPFSVFSRGVCGTLQINKSDYINMIQGDRVFLFNILNLLSRNTQRNFAAVTSLTKGSIPERIAQMINMLTYPEATDIKIAFRQKDFSTMLGAQRTSFINALNHMKEAGAIDYSLTELMVKDREKLMNLSKTED